VRLSLKPIPRGAAVLAILALGACVSPSVPTPAPTPAPAPPAAPPVPPQFAGNWMDAPATPGDWTYQAGRASFGEQGAQPLLLLRCDRSGAAIKIIRSGAATAAQPMRVLTEFQSRALDTVPGAGDPATVVARLSAQDALLDAMAFSKGRFAIEIAGLQTLYVPSWSEVTRVIEDCR